MKHIKYFIITLIIAGFAACELPDNVDPKGASEVPAETLFSNGLLNFVNQVDELNQNWNISRLLAQYSAQTTYYDEGRYNWLDRNIPDSYWAIFYRDALMDLEEARKLINAADPTAFLPGVKENQLAMIEICQCYTYQVLVDAFGDVPYSGSLGSGFANEALLGVDNPTPAYDDGEAIYGDIIDRLEAAVATLTSATGTGAGGFGSADFLFGGDDAEWAKFGNSLLLRIAMRLSDQNPTLSVSTFNGAVAGAFGVAESATFHFWGTTPHIGCYYEEMVEGGRNDYVPANTLVDTMVGLADPRLALYFDDNLGAGAYVGGAYGFANSWASCSHWADNMMEPDFPFVLIDGMEVQFLMAEAAHRGGYNVTGTEQSYYEAGVTQSILDWGGTAADATAYLAAAATWDGTKGQLALQKWLGLYNRGIEAWAEIRRLDDPKMNVGEDLTYADYPERMPYSYNEDNLNLDNYNAAAAAIGGDTDQTRLFWDVAASPYD